jgi:DNA-binding MarR family transcriptional regulator
MDRTLSTPQEVLDALREMTGQSVVLGEAIARRAGLRPADLEVLGVIEQRGPLTAGQLGEATGLSPAAVTGLIDRLEHAGVAARRHDSGDRRRVLVEVAPGAGVIAALYGDMERDALALLARRSARELAVLAAFLRDMHELALEHVTRLQPPESGG